jgi:hypothetical protein
MLRASLGAACAAAVVAFYVKNHGRVRRAKNCMRAIRMFPPRGAPDRPFPLVFPAGTTQKADVWRKRMEMLAAAGYECHALDFVQTGRYVTSYHEQMDRIRNCMFGSLELWPQRPPAAAPQQAMTSR